MKQLVKVALLLAFAVYGGRMVSQTTQAVETPLLAATMTSVANARYPPLPLQASISGDVVLRLGIRKDGSVESAVALSGHPMLATAALESARQSQFECASCNQDVTPYSVTYSYKIEPGPGWPCSESHQHTTLTANTVSIVAEPHMVDPYFASVKMPSAKCLYLWSCRSHWGGEEYFYFPARSAKCLGLWNCGHHLREPFATCQRLGRDIW